MSEKSVATRVWIWFDSDGTRCQIVKASDNSFWHCPIGLGGKRLGIWEPGFPAGLDPLPEWLQNH